MCFQLYSGDTEVYASLTWNDAIFFQEFNFRFVFFSEGRVSDLETWQVKLFRISDQGKHRNRLFWSPIEDTTVDKLGNSVCGNQLSGKSVNSLITLIRKLNEEAQCYSGDLTLNRTSHLKMRFLWIDGSDKSEISMYQGTLRGSILICGI